eukprot:m.1233914 g.1233914  ORF g.1233914 m.1233914 type:complete len:407 (-) comp24663_c0_seq24:1482-2702(-)
MASPLHMLSVRAGFDELYKREVEAYIRGGDIENENVEEKKFYATEDAFDEEKIQNVALEPEDDFGSQIQELHTQTDTINHHLLEHTEVLFFRRRRIISASRHNTSQIEVPPAMPTAMLDRLWRLNDFARLASSSASSKHSGCGGPFLRRNVRLLRNNRRSAVKRSHDSVQKQSRKKHSGDVTEAKKITKNASVRQSEKRKRTRRNISPPKTQKQSTPQTDAERNNSHQLESPPCSERIGNAHLDSNGDDIVLIYTTEIDNETPGSIAKYLGTTEDAIVRANIKRYPTLTRRSRFKIGTTIIFEDESSRDAVAATTAAALSTAAQNDRKQPRVDTHGTTGRVAATVGSTGQRGSTGGAPDVEPAQRPSTLGAMPSAAGRPRATHQASPGVSAFRPFYSRTSSVVEED